MPQFGSNPSAANQNLSTTQDINGNAIISSLNNFGASPLGVAARTQTLYGIPNANFDLTCPDPNSAVENNNAIPYWNLEYSGTIATTMVYNATTQNWSVRMDPSGAASGDYAILKTRTYLLNDDALALRQKAYASLTKQGTTGTAQWSIVLSATYYDDTGAQLSTYNVGTAADTGTWTGINGITTSGSAAISTSAAYADIALTLTAAGSVSGTAKVDINSVLVATSQSTTGSFVISQKFTSSGTFTRPTGVDYVAVLAVGGGGGGGAGGAILDNVIGGNNRGGGGPGGAGGFVIAQNLYIGDQATVSVGVGSGGLGASAAVASKVTGSTTRPVTGVGGTATAGGASTFGSYISAGGGALGANGDASQGLTGNGGTATSTFYGATLQNGGTAGLGTAISQFPYVPSIGTGLNGGAGTFSIAGTSAVTKVYLATGGTAGTPVANSGVGGGGGGGAVINIYSTGGTVNVTGTAFGAAGTGAFGLFGSSGPGAQGVAGTTAVLTTANVGGTATLGSGGGGGGGGAAISERFTGAGSNNQYRDAAGTATGRAGSDGAAGFVTIVWVG